MRLDVVWMDGSLDCCCSGAPIHEFELTDFCADRTTDILLDHGYHMLVLPVGKPEDATAWSASDPIPYVE